MRLKFEKGMPPEQIAKALVKFIYDNSLVIGAVNVYIQTYDDELHPVDYKTGGDSVYICTPSDRAKEEYQEYVVKIRRKSMKVI